MDDASWWGVDDDLLDSPLPPSLLEETVRWTDDAGVSAADASGDLAPPPMDAGRNDQHDAPTAGLPWGAFDWPLAATPELQPVAGAGTGADEAPVADDAPVADRAPDADWAELAWPDDSPDESPTLATAAAPAYYAATPDGTRWSQWRTLTPGRRAALVGGVAGFGVLILALLLSLRSPSTVAPTRSLGPAGGRVDIATAGPPRTIATTPDPASAPPTEGSAPAPGDQPPPAAPATAIPAAPTAGPSASKPPASPPNASQPAPSRPAASPSPSPSPSPAPAADPPAAVPGTEPPATTPPATSPPQHTSTTRRGETATTEAVTTTTSISVPETPVITRPVIPTVPKT